MPTLRRLSSISLLALASILGLVPRSAEAADAIPASLAVPAGHAVAFRLEASGVQIYDCRADARGFAWVFRAPEATLHNHGGKVKGAHYAGPTWSSRGGLVVGAKVAGTVVNSSAIPWLLLRATANEGTGPMAAVTFIQRIDTQGGLAPATGCDADHADAVAQVDYTATYAFFSAAGSDGE